MAYHWDFFSHISNDLNIHLWCCLPPTTLLSTVYVIKTETFIEIVHDIWYIITYDNNINENDAH